MQKTLKKISTKSCASKLLLQRLPYIRSTISFTLLTIIISGCGKDLSAVKDFGETATQAKNASQEISQDIYQSCLRSLNYIPLNQPNNVFTEREQREKICNSQNQPSAVSVSKANEILIGYMETLGKLADNNIASPK